MEQDNNMPKHIAIIMDGNRRWAKERNLDSKLGHRQGAKTLEKIVRYANTIGLKYLTVYAFSTENWKRTKDEIGALMILLQNYLDDYSKRADTENIKIKVLGDITKLPQNMQNSIAKCMSRTKENTGVTLNIAFNYGGRNELLNAVKKIYCKVKKGELDIEKITEETISNNLYTTAQPDPDIVVRTGGELRLSNFLTWQTVYSEFVFMDKYWPEFENEDLLNIIEHYKDRKRNFGK